MSQDRPVGVEFSVHEARSVCAALDLAAEVMACCDSDGCEVDLRVLRTRVMNGLVIAEAEAVLRR